MKVGGFVDGRLYATDCRNILRERSPLEFELQESFSTSTSGFDGVKSALTRGPGGYKALTYLVGRFSTTNVWPSSSSDWIGNVGNQVFHSADAGQTWTPTYRLPESSSRMGLLPTSVAYKDGIFYLGEYPQSYDETARILRSDNGGRTWSVECSLPDIRHIHAVQHDPYSGDLWVTTGDRDEECIIGRLEDGSLSVVGTGNQHWRAVELAFTPDSILWGMDCSYANEVKLFKLDRSRIPSAEPEVVGITDASVYYAETLSIDDETWVLFSTAKETGIDSTAPPNKRRNTCGPKARVIAASSSTGHSEWTQLVSCRKRSVLADRIHLMPTANAYVLMASHPDRGLFLNPYNTAQRDGELIRVPFERFRSL